MHNPKVNPLPLINPLLIGLATFPVVSLNRCLPVSCWQVIVQFQPSSIPDEWGTTPDGQTRPRVVKRGIDDDLDEVTDGRFCRRSCVAFQRLFANVCVVENFLDIGPHLQVSQWRPLQHVATSPSGLAELAGARLTRVNSS